MAGGNDHDEQSAALIRPVYLATGEPYIDEPETCPYCGGDGWYVGHEDECYEDGACSCSGVQIQCECQAPPREEHDGIAF